MQVADSQIGFVGRIVRVVDNHPPRLNLGKTYMNSSQETDRKPRHPNIVCCLESVAWERGGKAYGV